MFDPVRDPFLIASEIICQLGDDAAAWIATRVGEMILVGNGEGLRTFELIAAAFEELTAKTLH